jgi:hypothetical protein
MTAKGVGSVAAVASVLGFVPAFAVTLEPALATLPVAVLNPSAPSSTAPRCPAAVPASGPGVIDPFHVPTPAAAQQNADGKLLYRQGRWEEARQKYRTAEALDPDFLAPALNVACSFVRQERFGEALSEVLRLIDRAYLPWSQEVLSAADLGALRVHETQGKGLRAILEAARLRWAEGVGDDLIMVARLRPPLRLGDSQGGVGREAGPRALVLGLRQEVFAWSPWTRRYRQLTSEDGRVLAVARSRDGHRIAYVTAEKLVRGSDDTPVLRGVVVSELDLGTLAPLGRGSLEGDVRRLELLAVGGGFAYRVVQGASTPATLALVEGGLRSRTVSPNVRATVTLTGRGIADDPKPVPLDGRCGGSARVMQSRNGGPPTIIVSSPWNGQARVAVGGPHGSGLSGLPIP